MNPDKKERNKNALFLLVFSLIIASVLSFSGWAIGKHRVDYYENTINPFLGGLFLTIAIIVIIVLILRKKIK